MFRNSVIGVSNIFPKGSHRENVDPEILRIDRDVTCIRGIIIGVFLLSRTTLRTTREFLIQVVIYTRNRNYENYFVRCNLTRFVKLINNCTTRSNCSFLMKRSI